MVKRGTVEQPMPFESASERVLEDEMMYEEAKEIFGDFIMSDPNQAVHAVKARSLHSKLAEVYEAVGRIPKNGQAPSVMGGYKFAQASDVADTLRKEFARLNITMVPESIDLLESRQSTTAKGALMTTETYRVTWRITDGDTGQSITTQSVGTGSDTGDKASPKAQTNAMKYGLLMGFLVPTGDDPEAFVLEDQVGEKAAHAPIVINASNVSGVRQGGRQSRATEAQVKAIREHARKKQLDPQDLKLIIENVIDADINERTGSQWPEDAPNQIDAVIHALGSLSFDEAGTVLQAIMVAE